MVKDSKRPELSPTGLPKRPYVKRKPITARDGRLMLRVHEDVEELVKLRAEESGESVSRHLEKLIIGWLSADPRNPKLGATGARVPNVISPQEQKAADPYRFADRWQKFTTAHTLLHGAPPPAQWLEDFTAGSPADGDFDPTGEDPEPMPMPKAVKRMVENAKTKNR